MNATDPSDEPAAVFLHGFLGDRDTWTEISRRLEPRRVHLLDLPGHGAASHIRVGDPEGAVRWLAARIDALGLSRYRLVGYSMGGRLALMYARAVDQLGLGVRPTSLLVESAHPGLCDEGTRAARRVHDEGWAQRFEGESLQTVLRDWYRQPVFADLSDQERASLVLRRSQVHGPAVADMLRALSLSAQPDLRPWLQTTDIPVGWLTGARDTRYATLIGDLCTAIPRLYHHSMSAGHNVHRAAAAEFVEALVRGWQHLEQPADA